MPPPSEMALQNRLAGIAADLVRQAGAIAPADGARTSDLEKLRQSAATLAEVLSRSADGDGRTWRHELRNKLNRVTGSAQFLGMSLGDDGDGERDQLESIFRLASEFLATLESDAVPRPDFASAPVSATAPGRILVADDEVENRELMARLLEGLGHTVEFAENGRSALAAVREGDFDAVLLDINMPEMDGFAVLEELRESGHLRHTPVIVVTGLQEERDAVRGIEIGAEDFLSRPIRPALLTARLNASLEKKRLREKVFEQHFTPELAREFARNPDPMKMKGRIAEVSVLFCDIRGFSSTAERLGPESTLDWLGAVMGDFSTIVIDRGGVLVDYTGDELLAMWGAPGEEPDHAHRACLAALDMLDHLPALNEIWRPRTGAETAVGIGISTGPALVGNIGTHRKFKYGPLGTTVNLGSRIQSATKLLRTPVLATSETVRGVGEPIPSRRLGRVRVRNIAEPIELHELFGAGRSGWVDLKIRHEEALEHFENGRFTQAAAVLGDLLVAYPGDGPSLLLMSRVVAAMMATSVGDAFDPIWDLPGQ